MKKRVLLCLAVIGCAALFLAGCGNKEPQTATLKVDANPTTGYEWTVTQAPNLFDITSEYVEDEHAEGMTGVGGTETFTLTPKETGTATVEFLYARPSDPENADTRLTYTIKVKKDMQIQVESMTSAMGGTISAVPEMQEFEIK